MVLTIGIFVISGIEFNLSSIAAVLTIVGYSLNDTVVVYDRVPREPEAIQEDAAGRRCSICRINQMAAAHHLTSVTTLLALLALFMFGGEVSSLLHLRHDLSA